MFILFNTRGRKERENTELVCPLWDMHKKNGKYRPRIKYLESLGPFIKRYKCMDCGLTCRHDRTPIIRVGKALDKYRPKFYKPNF